MLASYEWIKELIDTGLPVEELGHELTMAGLEIEGLEKTGDGDHILEVNVTPNRPDCLSVLGIARELAAITGKPLTLPGHSIKEGPESDFTITIDDPDLCRRYTGRIVRGVKLGPAPEWMSSRLEKCGIRSINNIVDITNYVLLELGHPLHAFDLATLKGKTIRVTVAGKDNTITTLDEMERKLPEDALLIWDAERPVAVAGVMGGADTEVSDATTDILIESAWFKPQSIRRTSKTLGLKTEAAYRFERGTDLVMLEEALDRAASLVAAIAGGTVEKKIDTYPSKFEPRTFPVKFSTIDKYLGIEIPKDETIDILKRLGIGVKNTGETFEVTPPPHREDLVIEADIVEEVARIYGFDKIPTQPPVAEISTMGRDLRRHFTAQIKDALRKEGYHEAINYSFMNSARLDALGIPEGDSRRRTIKVLNPLRSEDAHMRTTLVPSLVENFAYNFSHGVRDIRLFETAKVFINKTENTPTGKTLPDEPARLGAVRFTEKVPTLYPENTEGFYLIKGAVESVLDRLKIGNCEYKPCSEPFMHPGKSADLHAGGTRLGFLGVLSPQAVERFDVKVKGDVLIFELDADALFEAQPGRVKYTSIPRYPSVERDIAILLDKGISSAQVVDHIRSQGSDLVEDVTVFDSYEGKGIPDGKKSLGVNVCYRSAERTLTDEEVEKTHKAIVEHIVKQTGGEIRSG